MCETTSSYQYTQEEVDAKQKRFVVECFVIQLRRMLPDIEQEKINAVAHLAEQAMTEVENLLNHGNLAKAIQDICPDEKIGEIVHNTLARFAPSIIGAWVHKCVEIMDDQFNAELFFALHTPK